MASKKSTGKTVEVIADGQYKLEEVFLPEYTDKLTVYQKNELVRTPKDELSILQAKLIRFVISQVLSNEKELRLFDIDIIELSERLKMRSNHIYETIREEVCSLITKRIFIQDADGKRKDKNYRVFSWVTYAEYKDGRIYIQLNPYLKPYLIGLNRYFSSYRLETLERFNRDITVRVYEWLNSYANIEKPARNYYGIPLEENEIIFDIETVKDLFLPKDSKGKRVDEYKNNSMFIKRVIEANLKKIGANTSFQIDYRVKKKKQEDGFHSYIIFQYLDF